MTEQREQSTARVGIAYPMIIFAGSILLAILLFALLNRPFEMMINSAGNHTSSATAARGQQYILQAWHAFLFMIPVMGATYLFMAARTERGGV